MKEPFPLLFVIPRYIIMPEEGENNQENLQDILVASCTRHAMITDPRKELGQCSQPGPHGTPGEVGNYNPNHRMSLGASSAGSTGMKSEHVERSYSSIATIYSSITADLSATTGYYVLYEISVGQNLYPAIRLLPRTSLATYTVI